MISILFCSRATGNPDSNIKRLLDSTVWFTTPAERAQIEFLIKYDDDDDRRPGEAFFAAYPFRVRTFSWSRGEGRHYLHHAQEYLFAQRDLRSRFVLMMSDDFHFTRAGWVSEILAVKEEFCILAPNRPPIESYCRGYEEDPRIREWVVSFGALAPVFSTRLVEVCQNFGWQSNVDAWSMALSIALYDLYEVVLWRMVEPFYTRGGGWGLGDTPSYNNMTLTGLKGPENKYWFELVRRQARNVYLNMRYGTDLRNGPSVFRRLWRRARNESLWRLPYRTVRKVYRLARAAHAAYLERQVAQRRADEHAITRR
jgi:hypothetical protein